VPATLVRLVRLGFEVRAELSTEFGPTWVQLTRGQAESLGLDAGDLVWLRPAGQVARAGTG
jgi:sulfate transport system ATP-binding protein